MFSESGKHVASTCCGLRSVVMARSVPSVRVRTPSHQTDKEEWKFPFTDSSFNAVFMSIHTEHISQNSRHSENTI